MLIAVVLGNRLNDDASISTLMRERLNLVLAADKALSPEKIIVSGGVANPAAGKSEAEVMRDILVAEGVEPSKIILEDKSGTTAENAILSVPIVAELGGTELLLITSPEHMHRWYLNPKKLFKKQLRKYGKIALRTCCTLDEIK